MARGRKKGIDSKLIGLRLPVDLIDKLTVYAESRLSTMQDVVRAGILLYMDKNQIK